MPSINHFKFDSHLLTLGMILPRRRKIHQMRMRRRHRRTNIIRMAKNHHRTPIFSPFNFTLNIIFTSYIQVAIQLKHIQRGHFTLSPTFSVCTSSLCLIQASFPEWARPQKSWWLRNRDWGPYPLEIMRLTWTSALNTSSDWIYTISSAAQRSNQSSFLSHGNHSLLIQRRITVQFN